MKLSDIKRTRDISIEQEGVQVKITIYQDLSWGDWIKNQEVDGDFDRGVDIFLKVIKDWDITDDQGGKLAITEENVRALPSRVSLAVLSKINEMFEELSRQQAEKKNGSEKA